MKSSDAKSFVTYCEASTPSVRDWKFKSDNQMGFLLLKDDKGYKYEVHVHYASMGNGIMTGVNVRWEGETQSHSVGVDTTTRLAKLCDAYLKEATNYNFGRDSGTKDI